MTEAEELDVIVVGAGLAGLSCAWQTASAGLTTAVLERGDVPGGKNLSGGRLYLDPVQDLCGDLLEGAPFERRVVSEAIVLTDDDAGVTIRVDGADDRERAGSVTVLRAKLDQHLAEKLAEKDAFALPEQKAEELLRDDSGRVVGVEVGGEELRAKVVVAADGGLSFLAERAGLRAERTARDYAVGIKEIIGLDAATIEARFNVAPGEGAARLYLGRVTRGLPGGGFLYTNTTSLSLGLVVHVEGLQRWGGDDKLWELLEAFKARPEIAPLVDGGETLEYGAHIVPEGGFGALPSAFGIPGLLLVGDAAGLVLNTGVTVRGMDLALVSGALAGRAIAENASGELDPEGCLASYQRALAKSFALEQLRRHRRAPELLALERLYERYPRGAVQVAGELFGVGPDGGSLSIGKAMKKLRKDVLGLRGLLDLWKLYRT
jgi:electron transfer flavoprotein-quinone oxidoreductase